MHFCTRNEILGKEHHIIYLAYGKRKGSRKMVRKYFAGANTATGYTNFMKDNLNGTEKVYALCGKSKKQKTEILLAVLEKAEDRYETVECIVSPLDITDIDGVIVRDIKTAVVDKDCIKDYRCKKVIELDGAKDEENSEVEELFQKEKWAMEEFYRSYAAGKKIHDDWEKFYIESTDYSRLDAYENRVIDRLLGGKKGKGGTQKFQRFFGASTPDGSVNYIDNLTEKLSARYFIKGRPGTGKSTFLKRLVKEAQARGFDTEIYYCSFDKNSLDMVVVPELGFCVFDSTAPHEMFPHGERDNILDFYKESGLCGIDEKYEKELTEIADKYKQKVAEGMAYLRLAKLYMKERECYLLKNRNESRLTKLKEEVVAEIMQE